MRHEAHFREHMWFKGDWADTGIYAILEQEWSGLSCRIPRSAVQNDADRIWELTIQPRPKLKTGQSVRLVIEYGGTTTRPPTSRTRCTAG